jgi:DNA-binding GntR family transcriptional regulator
MSLRSVAEILGVSMMPVREAVARLVAEQSLEVLPSRAVRVPLMTRARFRELTTVRLVIEGFAVEEAARNRAAADIEAMRTFEDAFKTEAARPDFRADCAVRANRELHFAIYRATGLTSLVGIIEGLWLQTGPILNCDLKVSPDRMRTGRAVECHRRLVAAIKAREPDAARAALVDDITGAATFIERTGRPLAS